MAVRVLATHYEHRRVEIVEVGPIVTHKPPLEKWKKAFDLIRVEKTAGKVLFTPK